MKHAGAVLFTVLIASAAMGARPPRAYQEVVDEGTPVTVQWDESIEAPAFVGWKTGESAELHPLHDVPENASSFTLERRGVNELPSSILVIPRNPQQKPVTLTIDDGQNSVEYVPGAASDDRAWLFGKAPKSICPTPMKHDTMDIDLRMLDNKSKNWTLAGTFAFSIKTDNTHRPFYAWSSSPAFKRIDSPGLENGTAATQTRCERHTGGRCDSTHQLKPDRGGRTYRINVEHYESLSDDGDGPSMIDCPRY